MFALVWIINWVWNAGSPMLITFANNLMYWYSPSKNCCWELLAEFVLFETIAARLDAFHGFVWLGFVLLLTTADGADVIVDAAAAAALYNVTTVDVDELLLFIDDESFDCCTFESFVTVVTEDDVFVVDDDDDDDNDVPEPVTDEATAAAYGVVTICFSMIIPMKCHFKKMKWQNTKK